MENNKEGLAITSLVTSIIGLFVFGLPLGIIAVITGYLSKDVSKVGKAGFIIGIIDVVLSTLYIASNF